MIKALLDINILLDFLKRREFYDEAVQVLKMASRREFKACASAHEITTLAYFMEKHESSRKEFRQSLLSLFEQIHILPVDQEILREALHSEITDYEDAVVEAVALKNSMGFIVTRNLRDFKHSRVKAVSPAFFLELLRDKRDDGMIVRERRPGYKTRTAKRSAKK